MRLLNWRIWGQMISGGLQVIDCQSECARFPDGIICIVAEIRCAPRAGLLWVAFVPGLETIS